MELNDLKLFALCYIKEDEVLSDKDKFKLMEFVGKSEQKDILFLLATGQMPGKEILSVQESDGVAYRLQEFTYTPGPLSAILISNLVKMGYHGVKTWKSVKDPYKEHEKSTQELETTTSAAVSMAAAIGMKIKAEHIKNHIKDCKKETGMAKNVCNNKLKRDGMRHEITVLSGLKNTVCNKTKDPISCKKNLDSKIKLIQKKMDSIKVF